jgi:hypothetical protein
MAAGCTCLTSTAAHRRGRGACCASGTSTATRATGTMVGRAGPGRHAHADPRAVLTALEKAGLVDAAVVAHGAMPPGRLRLLPRGPLRPYRRYHPPGPASAVAAAGPHDPGV